MRVKTPRSHSSYAKASESENPECAAPAFHTPCAWKEFRTSRTLAVQRVLCYDLHSTRRTVYATRPLSRLGEILADRRCGKSASGARPLHQHPAVMCVQPIPRRLRESNSDAENSEYRRYHVRACLARGLRRRTE